MTLNEAAGTLCAHHTVHLTCPTAEIKKVGRGGGGGGGGGGVYSCPVETGALTVYSTFVPGSLCHSYHLVFHHLH